MPVSSSRVGSGRSSPSPRLDGPPRNPAAAATFATYFDRNYLSRGLALIRSLRRHSPASLVWVLCLDGDTYTVLARLQLPHVRLVALADLEHADAELAATRSNRSQLEYYYTLTASFLLHVLAVEPTTGALIYVDADVFFFANPEGACLPHPHDAILLVDHHYPADRQSEYKYGRYNVGFIVFRNHPDRLPCLQSWRAQCIDWCYDYVDGNRYGDQKYLDDWPQRFRNVTVIQHRGVGLAPWNVATFTIHQNGQEILVSGDSLIAYHFHSLRIIADRVYDAGLHRHKVVMSKELLALVYRPYLAELRTCARLIRRVSDTTWHTDSVRRKTRYGPLNDYPLMMKAIQFVAAIRRRDLLLLWQPAELTERAQETFSKRNPLYSGGSGAL